MDPNHIIKSFFNLKHHIIILKFPSDHTIKPYINLNNLLINACFRDSHNVFRYLIERKVPDSV